MPSSTLTFDGAGATDSSRQRLETAAVELFAARGFMATTVREITAAVGLTPGSLYNHFPSKELLLYSIIRATGDELLAQIDRELSKAGSPPDRLRAFVEAFVRFHCRFPREARIANREFEFLPSPYLEESAEIRRNLRRRLELILEEGTADGSFSLTPAGEMPARRANAMAILDMCVNCIEPYWTQSRLAPTQIARVHADFALRLVSDSWTQAVSTRRSEVRK